MRRNRRLARPFHSIAWRWGQAARETREPARTDRLLVEANTQAAAAAGASAEAAEFSRTVATA